FDCPPPQAAGPGLPCLQSLRSVADSSLAVYGQGDGRFGCRCIIIRTAPRRFQVAYARESSQILTHFVFANPVPERPYRANRPTQLRTNRGEFIGNLRISAQPVSRVRDLPRDDRRHVFNTRFPVLLPRSPAAGTTLGSRLQNATFCAW